MRLPSHLTATGRAILSALPRNQVRALYPNRQAFTDRTGIGPKSPKELEATLAETQRTGFAEEHGDVTPGFDSYAVAVRDYNDFPIAGLALTFVSGSLRPEQERSLKTKLRLAGTELSRRGRQFDMRIREIIVLGSFAPITIFSTKFTDSLTGNAKLAGFSLTVTAIISLVVMTALHALLPGA